MSGLDAPRGALSHYCEMKGGKVSRYAAVPASNWNFAPRDDDGVRGPVEQALIGTPVATRTSRSRSCGPSTPSILEWLVRFT